MAYQRKTQDTYVIQGNYGYGHGWEDVSTYDATEYANAKADLREYRASRTGAHRLITRREKIKNQGEK